MMTRPLYHEKHGDQYMVLSVVDDHVNLHVIQMVMDSQLSPEGSHTSQIKQVESYILLSSHGKVTSYLYLY
jgi:hypothetical protein